ncbi:hypothetical protein ACP4OV_020017 [Aristida adscensionis]
MAASTAPVKAAPLALLVVLLCLGHQLGSCSSELSIVGYSEEDLSSPTRLFDLFERWLSRHGKAYASMEEKLRRFEVFKDNLRHIDETNRRVSSYWLGLNAFADLTHAEFKATHLGLAASPSSEKEEDGRRRFMYEEVDAAALPRSVDWREKGAVTAVKDQGRCGSCWAFSAVAAVEGVNQIVTGNLTALSEQELIDCDTDGNRGCGGGVMDRAFAYIARAGGLRAEDAYPYLMEEGSCRRRGGDAVVTISGYEDVPRNDEQALLKALAHQPLSVAIDASGRNFQFYSGGVFDGPCGVELDHGVAAVGYGTAGKGQDYIIVKNSWGAKWGEKGYIRMRRGTGKRHGLCGINRMASYPTKHA